MQRRGDEEQWDVPSGRMPQRRDQPISLKATFWNVGRGRKAAGSKAKGRVAPAGGEARRVVVKVRVMQLGKATGTPIERLAHLLAKRAAKLHLSYLEREGVQLDGSAGRLYGVDGDISRTTFEEALDGEKHQFRIVISPEDGEDLDLDAYVREYMQRVERDLGQKLRWAAVNHYNTDNPHAHVVIRGVDAQGAEVRMDPEYVSHGLRNRASELATQELGPRPARSRVLQMKREAHLERYTGLDAALERRAVDGVVQPPKHAADPHLESALKRRLEFLKSLGLATRDWRLQWHLSPQLREELGLIHRRAAGVRTIEAVLPARADQARIIDRQELSSTYHKELERGIQGVIRWKGLDEQGHFCAVVETTGGLAYHLPISNRIAHDTRVGQIVEIKCATDKDLEIERVASQAAWTFDTVQLGEGKRAAYRARLEQLERMKLATPEGPERWKVEPDFRDQIARAGKAQRYWQMVAPRAVPQRLADQIAYEGYVWLDRVDLQQLGSTGFGGEVRTALRKRYEYLRGMGLDPQSERLRWELERRQRRRLEHELAARGGVTAVRPSTGLEGTVRIHRERNGECFLEVRSRSHFFVRAAGRADEALDGKTVRVQLDGKGRVRLEQVERQQRRDLRQP